MNQKKVGLHEVRIEISCTKEEMGVGREEQGPASKANQDVRCSCCNSTQ